MLRRKNEQVFHVEQKRDDGSQQVSKYYVSLLFLMVGKGPRVNKMRVDSTAIGPCRRTTIGLNSQIENRTI